MAPYLFLSHAKENRNEAARLCTLLESQGIACWMAPRDIQTGQDYGEAIIAAIEKATGLVLILSAEANDSQFVRREIERAVSKSKKVLIIRLQDVMPSAALELFVSSSQWLDAWSMPMEEIAQRIARSVSRARPPGSAPPPAAQGKAPPAAAEVRKVAPAPKDRPPRKGAVESPPAPPAESRPRDVTVDASDSDDSDDRVESANGGRKRRFPPRLIGGVALLFVLLVAYVVLRSRSDLPLPSGLPGSLENLLDTIYTTPVEGGNPEVYAEVEILPGGITGGRWQTLTSGEAISTRDRFRIRLLSAEPAFFYILQIDSAGGMRWLSPKNKATYSVGVNPVMPDLWTFVPPSEQYPFDLVDAEGIDHLYVIAVRERWKKLERLLAKADSAKLDEPLQQPLYLRNRGTLGTATNVSLRGGGGSGLGGGSSRRLVAFLKGHDGVSVREFWFRHVSS